MPYRIEQNISAHLSSICKPYIRRLTICTLLASIAMITACSSESKGNPATNQSVAPSMTNEEAVTLSKVALSTFPQLPIDMFQTVQEYGHGFNSISTLKVSAYDSAQEEPATQPTQTENCSGGGFIERVAPLWNWPAAEEPLIEGESFYGGNLSLNEPPISNENPEMSVSSASVTFNHCVSSVEEEGVDSHKVTQDGSLAISSISMTKPLPDKTLARYLVATFTDYSYAETANNTSSLTLIDGEFGIAAITDSAHAITTNVTATGTINTTTTATSLATYDSFELLFEQSEKQDLITIYGNVIADMENQQYRYSLSTIEPMGTVNGIVQGSFLLESGGSKLFIDRINTEEVTLSADYDDDGSIDYSTVIPLPLADFITAKHFSSLPF